MSRTELVRIADSYFEGIDTGIDSSMTPFWEDCQRRENGTITANNPKAAKGSMANLACKQQFDTGFQTIVTDIRDRRIWVADTERQLVCGFGFFDHSGVGSPKTTTGAFAKPFTFQIAEAFKVRDGKIQQIEAYLYSVPNYRERTDFDRLYEAKGSSRTTASRSTRGDAELQLIETIDARCNHIARHQRAHAIRSACIDQVSGLQLHQR